MVRRNPGCRPRLRGAEGLEHVEHGTGCQAPETVTLKLLRGRREKQSGLPEEVSVEPPHPEGGGAGRREGRKEAGVF